MPCNVIHLDGEEQMLLQFENKEVYLEWQRLIGAIKQEAARIISAYLESNDIGIEGEDAIRCWLRSVDAMVEAHTPVPPSIMRARVDLAGAVGDN